MQEENINLQQENEKLKLGNATFKPSEQKNVSLQQKIDSWKSKYAELDRSPESEKETKLEDEIETLKTKKNRWIAIVVLVLCLVIVGYFVGFIQIGSQSAILELQPNVTQLREEKARLELNFNNLMEKNSKLQQDSVRLQRNYATLEQSNRNLRTENEKLKTNNISTSPSSGTTTINAGTSRTNNTQSGGTTSTTTVVTQQSSSPSSNTTTNTASLTNNTQSGVTTSTTTTVNSPTPTEVPIRQNLINNYLNSLSTGRSLSGNQINELQIQEVQILLNRIFEQKGYTPSITEPLQNYPKLSENEKAAISLLRMRLGWNITSNSSSSTTTTTNTSASNAQGSRTTTATSNVATTVNPQPPIISAHPSNGTVTARNRSRTISVKANPPTGGSLSYQWYSNTNASNSRPHKAF